MDAVIALQILQWVAIVVVYLGFAALLRETRLLRGQVSRLQLQVSTLGGEAGARAEEEPLPERVTGGRDGVVVVADTTCPSCALVLERLMSHRGHLRAQVTLLTWEPEEDWSHLESVRIVRDAQAWSNLAHLTPPILLRVEASGRIASLHLPSGIEDIDATLTSWGVLAPATERDLA